MGLRDHPRQRSINKLFVRSCATLLQYSRSQRARSATGDPDTPFTRRVI